MNSVKDKQERRRSPRVRRQIPLKIKHDDYDVVGQTHDISSIGAYCTISRHIPPFSLISIILLLPLRMENKSSICNVRCQGVVVRSQANPQNSQEFNTAIYFNRISKSDKAKLLQYVQQ
ncbi:PilZ domain-containing protein [Candidatus Omnitrophota bacterium]